MIPKKIHYVRLGGKEMPKLAKKCIKSWKKYLPDYELCLRNEENFDINSNQYVKDAYEAKKFAFVRDYIRIRAMYTYGGISMDTDVEVLKNLNRFLDSKGFSGFENENLIPTGIMASEKGNEFIGEILHWYQNNKFDPKCSYTNVTIITNIAKDKFGFKGGDGKELVKLKGDVYEFYPKNYFCPISHRDQIPNYKKYLKDNNCYTIHWFAGSWLGKSKCRRFIDKVKYQVLKRIEQILKKIHLYEITKKLYHKMFK